MPRLAALVLVVPAVVFANGGPVEYGVEPGLRGVPVPVDEGRVSLVSEELVIRLPKNVSGAEFDVEARYTLRNAGKPVELTYAVPGNVGPPVEMVFPPHGGRGRPTSPPAPGRLLPREEFKKGPVGPVSISVGGRTYTCSGKPMKNDVAYTEGQTWCTTKLTIPSGDAVVMVLKYRDRLLDAGDEGRECPVVRTEQLGLVYDFHPAGYWAGPVSRLQVRVELGGLDGLEEVKGLPGGEKEGATLVWDLKDVDLKTLPMLDLSFHGPGRALRPFVAKRQKSATKCLAPMAGSPSRFQVTTPLSAPLHGNQGDPLVADELCGLVVTLDPAVARAPRKVRLGPCADGSTTSYEVELPATAPFFFIKADGEANYPSCRMMCEFFDTIPVAPTALVPRDKKSACLRVEFLGEPPCVTGLVPVPLSNVYE